MGEHNFVLREKTRLVRRAEASPWGVPLNKGRSELVKQFARVNGSEDLSVELGGHVKFEYLIKN